MKNEIVKVDPSKFGLDPKGVKTIEQAFLPKIAEREGLEKIYSELLTMEITEATCSKAGEVRRKLVKVRTGIAEVHRVQKAFFLASGKFVDAWKNKETLPITQMEENLSKIEKHFEIQEKKRLEELQSKRVIELSKYVGDAHERDLSSMDKDVWKAYLDVKKSEYIDMLAAEAKVEKDRVEKEKAEKAERVRLKKENEKLKVEAKKRAEQERIRLENEAKEKAKLDAKLEKERKVAADKLKAEQAEKDRIAKELQDKKDEEAKVERERLATEQAELSKGDTAKVKDLVEDLTSIKVKYSFKSDNNKAMYEDVQTLVDKVINHINKYDGKK